MSYIFVLSTAGDFILVQLTVLLFSLKCPTNILEKWNCQLKPELYKQ